MSALPAMMMATSAALQIGGGVGGFLQSRRQAKMLEDVGFAEAAERRREGAKLIGAQRAAYAKAGVSPDIGTPLQMQMEAAETSELEALREIFRGKVAAKEAKGEGMAILGQSFLGALGSGYEGFQAMPKRKTGTTKSFTTTSGWIG